MLTGRARLIAAAAILIPAVIYLGMENERRPESSVEQPSPAHQQSDYYIVEARIRDFNDLGLLKQQLSARQLEHQPAMQQTLVIEPKLVLHNNDQPDRIISSQTGVIRDNNEQITLAGNVILQDNPEPRQANKLQTESLLFLPKQNLIQSESRVTLSGKSSTTTATGLKINTDSGILTLLSDVKGVHNVK